MDEEPGPSSSSSSTSPSTASSSTNNDGGSSLAPSSPSEASLRWVTTSNFHALLHQHLLSVNSNYDPVLLLLDQHSNACQLITDDFYKHNGIKYYVVLKLKMVKVDLATGESTAAFPCFSSRTTIIHHVADVASSYEKCVMEIAEHISNFNENGSNFNVESVVELVIYTAGYRPLSAARHFPLPVAISAKRACVNIENIDDKCFYYNVLLALNIDEVDVSNIRRWPRRLLRFQDQVNFSGVRYPVTFDQISKIESQNAIAITIIGYERGEFFPMRTSALLCEEGRKRVDMLYLKQNAEAEHFVLISNLDRLLSTCRSQKNGKKYTCRNCFHQFCHSQLLTDHEPFCLKMKCQKLTFPSETEKILTFKQKKFTLKRPYVCLADFEMMIRPADESGRSRHVPMAVSFLTVDEDGVPWHPIKVLHGEDCGVRFLKQIEKIHADLERETRCVMKPLTHEQEVDFMDPATLCSLCERSFELHERVRHHSHTSGEYLGVLCSPCNLQLTLNRNLVVAFHNGSNYDFVEIVRALKIVAPFDEITVIAKNSEKFSSITWKQIRFIDSYNLLSASLGNLAKTLQPSDFKLLASFFPEVEQQKLLTQKMLFPYTYFKDASVLTETCLPPREAYFNDLTEEECSIDDYQQAKLIWEKFNLKSLKELVSLYVRADVILLSDVLVAFRKTLFDRFGLDVMHFISLPSFSWSCCLKLTGLSIELLTDNEMYCFWQRGMFGGFTTVVSQHEKANNPLCSEYDPSLPTSYLCYLDAVSLYGTTMAAEKFPVGEFKWLTDLEGFDPLETECTGQVGYLVEANLTFPDDLHDYFADFPPCPLKRRVAASELSSRSEMLATMLNLNPHQTAEKLVSDLHPRVGYVLPLKTLQFIVSLGVCLDSVTKVLQYQQKAILAPYINKCLELRAQAPNKLESDILKLLSNCIFGYSLRDCLSERDMRLVFNKKAMGKLINSPRFLRAVTFDVDAAVVEMRRSSVKVKSPIFIGISILSFSKNRILEFWYQNLKQEYGESIKLAFSDTDSLVFKVTKETDNFYEQELWLKFGHLMDTSNYPSSSPLFSLERKKKPGCFSDELGGRILEEIVCLKPKCYCVKIKNDESIIRSKGVPKSKTKRFLFEDYKTCLFEGNPYHVNYKQIGKKKMALYTLEQQKVALSSFENKRFWLEDVYRSLPFGHKSIKALARPRFASVGDVFTS